MFELATPWVLIAIPIPFLVWFLLPAVRLRLSAALKLPFFKAIEDVIESGEKRSLTMPITIMLLIVIWLLLLFALAGPRWVGKPQPATLDGYNIMLVLDVSPSMAIRDMLINRQASTRLAVVKRTAMQFVRDRISDKIGLILFGERAYLLTPLTYDHRTVSMRLDESAAGLAGNTTSLGDALGLAVKRLQHVSTAGRMIILLTDGVNNSGVLAPLKAAELARAKGIHVYTIGLGSSLDPDSFDSLFLNMNGAADLDEDTLKAIAKMTGGRYFRATDIESLQKIYQQINKMATVSQKQSMVRPQYDYYPWPLALALLLFLVVLITRSGLSWGNST